MYEAEGFNFKVGLGPNAEGKRNKTPININLDDIMYFIGNLSISEQDKQTLIKVAKKTPHGSLINFKRNYMNYLKKRT